MRYFLKLRYKGAQYRGWQIQPNVVSVQEVINDSLEKLLGSSTETIGCGRTDAGVHAREFYLHFDFDKRELDLKDFVLRLTGMKLPGIQFLSLHRMADDAHARFHALSRSYEYWIITERDPFLDGLAYYHYKPLDIEAMNKACSYLLGKKDFSCFSKTNTQVMTSICDLSHAQFVVEDYKIIFKITANRFLRNMVRAIVGTLIEIGEGKRSPEWIEEVIHSQSRTVAGSSVEACGLYLTKITYPENFNLSEQL
ncbi:MAG: tRNA pseudouridine(38-40) synthase TruA [Bacteroidia bacterium]